MKIGIIGCIDYPNLSIVQELVSKLQWLYRPLGNFDDEYEETIELLTLLENNLDCIAVVEAAKANFTVILLDTLHDLIKQSDRISVFYNGESPSTKLAIASILESKVPFEVIYPPKEK